MADERFAKGGTSHGMGVCVLDTYPGKSEACVGLCRLARCISFSMHPSPKRALLASRSQSMAKWSGHSYNCEAKCQGRLMRNYGSLLGRSLVSIRCQCTYSSSRLARPFLGLG